MNMLTSLLLLIVFLHPVPEQTDKPNANQNAAKNSQQAPNPRTSASDGQQPITQNEDRSSNSKPDQPTWREQVVGPLIANWPLVLVAAIGIWVAWRTLDVIGRQTDEMAKSVEIIISKERFRISIRPPTGLHLPFQADQTTHEPVFQPNHTQTINYGIRCYGLTEGFILEAFDGACLSTAEESNAPK